METDVRENIRSLFRFLGLAAFILGPLWYLLKVFTGGLWLSGMLGLVLALVGYITVRLVDEEKGWKGSVLRAARWALGKIRSWPRWLRGGLLSLVAAGTLFIIAACAGLAGLEDIGQLSIAGGVIAPFLLFDSLPLPDTGLTSGLMWMVGISYWFFLGTLLGKLAEKTPYAWLLWIVIYIPGSLYVYTWASGLS